MELFESHCHFDFADFDADRAEIWRQCQALGIRQLLIPGVHPATWPRACALAAEHRHMYFGVGLHPWWIETPLLRAHSGQYLEQLDRQLADFISHPKCVALGECGLDAAIAIAMNLQQRILDRHLLLAQQTSLPLILHCRKAHGELISQLKAYKLLGGGVIHGFSGSYDLAMSYWAMGFRLGIGGTITYARAHKTRDAVVRLPLAALLLETDGPDMPLFGRQGERNSPVNLIDIAQTLADLRGVTLAHIAESTSLNAQTLFKMAH